MNHAQIKTLTYGILTLVCIIAGVTLYAMGVEGAGGLLLLAFLFGLGI